MITQTQPIVTIKDFSLNLGGKQIVTDLSFDVQPGEVFALLGANGSGKTSTIRSLLNIYQPTTGQLLIDGQPYSPERAHVVGYLPEERGLYLRSTVIDVMTYFGELKGMDRGAARAFSLQYLERVGLAEQAKLTIKKLSGGQQQKVQLGVAIINEPKLLILDEPTKALDPVNRKLLLDVVEEYRQKGTAVIYITHLMEEVERLADRILIIKDGVRVAYGTKEELKKTYNMKSIEDIFVSIYTGDNA
ncbi:MAG TPA: ATP-binding cassette domain-containing protein [Candidatus Saccharimonadales bacterium]|nr:ATP-binding cassette domain-containing protein [Candidatus Saccharimonadales bacterium]